MRKRRNMDGASLSFLDVMSCGFGAVVLLYLIINHNTEKVGQIVNQELLAALRVLDYQVLEGEKDLAEMVKKVDETKRKIEIAERRLIADKDQLEKQSDTEEEKPDDSAAKEPTLDDLKFEVESMEKDVKRLRAAEEANEGGRLLRIQGEGNRQYLTGLRIGGRNIAIAIDGSASMMDPSIVNVLRRRYQSDAAKRAAPKWNRAVRTVDWLAAQLPLDSHFQLIVFNDKSTSLSTPGKYEWTPVGDGRDVRASLERLREHVPNEGTSLENVFLELRNMKPMPDNVYLITDSLPTMGVDKPRSSTISGEKRLELFRDARQKMPNNIPINVIMFPMEGDPFAAGAFWNLARATGGAFMSPSKDWP